MDATSALGNDRQRVARRSAELHRHIAGRADCASVVPQQQAILGLAEAAEGGLLHAKTITVDSDISLVSSANLDRRSLFLNFEAGLYVYDQDFTSQLRFLQQSYIESSRTVDPARWNERGVKTLLAENAAGLLSPLL